MSHYFSYFMAFVLPACLQLGTDSTASPADEIRIRRARRPTGQRRVVRDGTASSVTRQALVNGLVPFYWDNGVIDQPGSGLFDRHDGTVFDAQAIEALVRGAVQ